MKQYTFKNTLHACYLGYITQAIIVNLVPLLFVIFQTDFNISLEMIGRLVLLNFGTQLAVDVIAVNFADKIGYRVCAVLGHLCCAVGLVSIGLLPGLMADPYTGLVISVVIYAAGGGLIEVLVSPIVDSLPGDAKASAMSLLHSFYCWGQVLVVVVTTLLLRWIGSGMWFVLPVMWAAIPIYNIYLFLKVPLMPNLAKTERIPIRKLLMSKIFLVAMLLMMCAGASELAMSQWASLFAEKGLQISKTMGDLLGPCLFAVFMGIGRTVYGIWGHKINLKRTLILCSAMCVICYLVTALARNPIVSLMGCALTGLAVSLVWPGMLSLSAANYPVGGTAMFGILAVCGDLGCSVGPWITGIVADSAQNSGAILQMGMQAGWTAEQIGLRAGILSAVIFPAVMLGGVVLLAVKTRKAKERERMENVAREGENL